VRLLLPRLPLPALPKKCTSERLPLDADMDSDGAVLLLVLPPRPAAAASTEPSLLAKLSAPSVAGDGRLLWEGQPPAAWERASRERLAAAPQGLAPTDAAAAAAPAAPTSSSQLRSSRPGCCSCRGDAAPWRPPSLPLLMDSRSKRSIKLHTLPASPAINALLPGAWRTAGRNRRPLRLPGEAGQSLSASYPPAPPAPPPPPPLALHGLPWLLLP
jgi:hypothetical protein